MRKKKKQKKKTKGRSVQELIGVKTFTTYGLETTRGELLFYLVAPTNISVLSPATIELQIRHLMMVLSAIPEIEIACTDSSECFDESKLYLKRRAREEPNERIRALIEQDIAFLDNIQSEMATARQFLFIVRVRGLKEKQVFETSNRIVRTISEQNFEVRRMEKSDIKRFLALYFDASVYGEQMPDVDGAQYFEVNDHAAES